MQFCQPLRLWEMIAGFRWANRIGIPYPWSAIEILFKPFFFSRRWNNNNNNNNKKREKETNIQEMLICKAEGCRVNSEYSNNKIVFFDDARHLLLLTMFVCLFGPKDKRLKSSKKQNQTTQHKRNGKPGNGTGALQSLGTGSSMRPSHIVTSAPKCSSRHFTFHRKLDTPKSDYQESTGSERFVLGLGWG